MADAVYWLAFFVFAILAVGAGVLVVTSEKIIYSALFLVATFVGVAGIYVLLLAEFVAGVQVLIYIGAITVLVLFAIMLTQRVSEPTSNLPNRQSSFALIVSVITGAMLVLTIYVTEWPVDTGRIINESNTLVIGEQLFTTYVLPFEIASLLLLAAMVGAIVLAREE